MNTASEIALTNSQARQFLLCKQGLLGGYRFSGGQGVMEYIRQAGCIQYDPIDVCGKNAELVLQSRVKGFKKQMLYDLLYKERALWDYFDKNLAIMPMTDWAYFSRYREASMRGGISHDEVSAVAEQIKAEIAARGPLASGDFDYDEKVHWHWSDTRLSRAALESLYFRGELAVHHKKGTQKYYDLAENCIPTELLAASDPYPDIMEHLKWRVLRRIGAIGLLWNKPSDGWLNIDELKSAERGRVFKELLDEGKIIPLAVEGIGETLYCLSSDEALLNTVMESEQPPKPRCELIAPLDNLMWDRKLIKAIFGFDYKWEIYTPAAERRYGYYVLPLLYGDSLVGRAELVCNRRDRVLTVKNIWYEPETRQTQKLQKAVDACIGRFALFNECDKTVDVNR